MSDVPTVRPGDPRPSPTLSPPPRDDLGATFPQVAAAGTRGGMLLPIGGAVALGAVTFLWLATHRPHEAQSGLPPPSAIAARESVAPMPAPPELAMEEAAGRGGGTPAGPVFVATAPPVAPQPVATEVAPPAGPSPSLRAPTLVVDFADGAGNSPPASSAAPTTGAVPVKGGPGAPNSLNGDEQFASRVGAEEPETSQAILLHHRASLVPQGTTITGVLETALNSDLPGYTRAVVSRDVRGFDGSQILIPRGSRVIGQYKSAVAQGQTRAFVIWTRIIRPDGASIQIGSSGTDPLGRAGLAGKVDTHFFERFAGAILLSVINAELINLTERSNSTQIVIGSTADATNASLAALIPTAIPPTIKVAQGAPIRIFVARDLDFSTVQSSEP